MRAMASLSVPATSVLMPSLLKPMCESLICTKLKLPLRHRCPLRRARAGSSAEPSSAAADRPKHARSGPGHAFEEAAAVQAVLVMVV